VKRFALLLLLAATPLAAQQAAPPPIDTDRPDFTDGTHTIAPGRFQFETGYTYQQARGTDAGYTHSLPEALFRIGVLSRIELRVGENYLVQHDAGPAAPSTSGFDDLYLGTKVSLTEAHGMMPALSFEVKANLPTGSDAISAHRWLPGGAILFGWESDGPWSAGVELFATRTADDNAQGVGSLSVQYQLASSVQLYTELYTVQPIGGNAGASGAHYANSGVLVLLSNNVQVDARVGVGLNDAADKYFLGFGFAVRR
jgi:Putative MetA-pathway of phenol degradation